MCNKKSMDRSPPAGAGATSINRFFLWISGEGRRACRISTHTNAWVEMRQILRVPGEIHPTKILGRISLPPSTIFCWIAPGACARSMKTFFEGSLPHSFLCISPGKTARGPHPSNNIFDRPREGPVGFVVSRPPSALGSRYDKFYGSRGRSTRTTCLDGYPSSLPTARDHIHPIFF